MDSKTVLDIFKEITRIPRESGHEEKMTAFLQEFAASHKLACKTDEIGNVVITKEASKGKENVPTLVLQGHQDMVCEKNSGVSHDFSKDPINFVVEDGWMVAKDTTLGADDGIGVAACLALLESDLPMGKIECLFTISEETGMDGAQALKPGFFSGKTLINLDSEEEGEFCIGCAGGVNTIATLPYKTVNRRPGNAPLSLRITGALGGHSGEDINKGRMNTIREMALFLREELAYGLQVHVFKGGNKPNAIARECEVIASVPDRDATTARFLAFGEKEKEAFKDVEPNVCFTASRPIITEKVLDPKDLEALVNALADCPHGVQAMSKDIPGLVETSTNLAAVSMVHAGQIKIVTSQRSSVTEERDKIAAKVRENFVSKGAEVEHLYPYPGWKPNVDSPILKVCEESYNRLFGKKPIVKAIHAGLECGLFLTKFPDLDMISFGPTLLGVHAPGERMELSSLDKFTKHLVDVVCNFR